MRFRFPSRSRLAKSGLPKGERVYAIGDIHGRLDLFQSLLGKIEADTAAREPVKTQLVILGDFIDRGPDSCKLIEAFASFGRSDAVIVLKGNHEAALIDAILGDHAAMDLWIEHGGIATLESFGADVDGIEHDDTGAWIAIARRVIPKTVTTWLTRLPTFHQEGGYYFVHAGIRPGIALNKQIDEDRLWIRDEFISSGVDHGAVIVHGHTIQESGIYFGANRIGVDTGAYRTHRLSAVGLEGSSQWSLKAESAGSVAVRD